MNRILTAFISLLLFNFGAAQNGKLLSKKALDIAQTPVWNKISNNGVLVSDYRHLDSLDFFLITYESDGLVVSGMLAEPKKAGKYPVVIFNRGGNRDFSQLTAAAMIAYTSKLATEGYVAIASNYRKNDEFGGAELNDVLYLLETVKEVEKADPDAVGMFGWSRGGMMAYLVLRKSDRIKTAIVGNGPADLFQTIAERPEMESQVIAECIPEYWKNKDSELERRSAICWADELCKSSSLLILCGTNDENVNPAQARAMAQKLKEIKYDCEFKEVETDHFFSGKKKELETLVIDWFGKKLKNFR